MGMTNGEECIRGAVRKGEYARQDRVRIIELNGQAKCYR